MYSLKEEACIVGVGETPYVRGAGSGLSEVALQLTASLRAIEDAGLKVQDIDGVMPGVFHTVTAEDIVDNLGLRNLRYSSWIYMGGASATSSLQTAAMAVATGQANYVLCVTGWNGYSGGRARSTERTSNADIALGRNIDNHYRPHGAGAPLHHYSWVHHRYMHEYGAKPEQFGAVAVAQRRHAQLNPKAVMNGRPMTMEDYLNAPMVAYPLRLFDCCLETDGAAAVIVTSAERARDLKHPPVHIMGVGMARPYPSVEITNRRDFLNVGVGAAGQRAFNMAGVTTSDIDFVEAYDMFTVVVLRTLEELGFCKRGEGASFVQNGRIEIGGELPVNTHGGHLSEAHVASMNHIAEAVRQLRGECGERQVDNAEVGLVTSWGGGWGACGVAIMRR